MCTSSFTPRLLISFLSKRLNTIWGNIGVSSCPSYWTLLDCTLLDMHCYKRRLGYPFEEDLEARSSWKAWRTNIGWCGRLVYSSLKKQTSHQKFMFTVSLCLLPLKIQEKFLFFSLLLTWLLASRRSDFFSCLEVESSRLFTIRHIAAVWVLGIFFLCDVQALMSVSCLRLLLSFFVGFLAFGNSSSDSSDINNLYQMNRYHQ